MKMQLCHQFTQFVCKIVSVKNYFTKRVLSKWIFFTTVLYVLVMQEIIRRYHTKWPVKLESTLDI